MHIIDEDYDVFDILGVPCREDTFTNLLSYIYNKSDIFKKALIERVFGNDVDEDIFFSVRNVFRSNATKTISEKNIPDILLYGKHHFAIIEVKVDSGEGYMQTQRYYDERYSIMDALGIPSDTVKQNYLFLTLTGAKPACSNFFPISWSEIGALLPTIKKNDIASDLDLMIYQLKKRIESIKQVSTSINDVWNESLNSYKWRREQGLESVLKLMFDQQHYIIRSSWSGFNNSTQQYSMAAQVGRKEWIGKNYLNEKDCRPEECFDIHFEIYWTEPDELEIRLDYELNPYRSKGDLQRLYEDNPEVEPLVVSLQEYRTSVARKAKELWNKRMKELALPKDAYCTYSKHIANDFIWIIDFDYSVKEDDSIETVISEISDFLNEVDKFVSEDLIPLIKK